MSRILSGRIAAVTLTSLLVLVVSVACCSGGKLPDIIAPIAQQAPVAVLAVRPAMAVAQVPEVTGNDPFNAELDATQSFDPDGQIVQYDWDFESDGAYDLLDGGAVVQHVYTPVGNYTATVRVIDNNGLSATATGLIHVTTDPIPPTAVGSATVDAVDPLLVHYDASASFDSDGEIVRYDWDFDNDGTFETLDGGVTIDNLFSDFETYTVGLRVTDDDGLTDATTITVTLTGESNEPPVANLVPTPASGLLPDLQVSWDASGSTDADGTIVRYDWDMDNDGTFEVTDGGASRAVTYTTPGTKTVGVRVTDDDGATDQTTAVASVNDPDNEPPVAAVVPEPASGNAPGLSVTFDASGSTDPDGTIVRYDWDMDNDGTFEISDAAVTQDAVYNTGGIKTVGVRVTDDDGASDTATTTVNVNEPPVASLQASPDSGTLSLGSFGLELNGMYDASASIDSDGTIVRYDWDMDNDGTFEISDGGQTQPYTYTAGGVFTAGVRVTDDDGATDTATASVDVNEPPVAVVSPEPPAGDSPLDVTFDASASTDPDGTIVQYDWDMDNDGTFEITDGGVTQGMSFSFSGVYTVGVRVTDDDGATDEASTFVDVNDPPSAVLTADPQFGDAPGLVVEFDASTSFDTDGTIVQYDWDMDNDGTFEISDGSATQQDTYNTGGLFTVGVRVTDNDGATGQTTVTVDVNNPPLADVVVDSQVLGQIAWDVTFDASGSTDSDGTIVQYDWDMDNDGTFEIIDGGVTQLADYTVDDTYTVGVRVTDDDGAQDTDTVDVEILTPPVASLFGHGDINTDYCAEWDASASFDPLGGFIVKYEFDLDDDGTFELDNASDPFAFFCNSYEPGDPVRAGVRVTDNDGNTDTVYFEFIMGNGGN